MLGQTTSWSMVRTVAASTLGLQPRQVLDRWPCRWSFDAGLPQSGFGNPQTLTEDLPKDLDLSWTSAQAKQRLPRAQCCLLSAGLEEVDGGCPHRSCPAGQQQDHSHVWRV